VEIGRFPAAVQPKFQQRKQKPAQLKADVQAGMGGRGDLGEEACHRIQKYSGVADQGSELTFQGRRIKA